MSHRTEVERELRRALSRAAGSVHVEDRWDKLVDRIETGDEPAPSVVATPRGPGRRWKPGVVFAAAFVAVVVVVGLSGLLGGRAPATDPQVVGATAQPSAMTLGEPALTWPPAIPTVEGQTEAAWHCPEVDVQPDRQLNPAEVPDDLRYLPAGDAPVDSAWGVNYGPGCARGPALVAVTFANELQTAVSAVVVVWVEQPASHLPSAEPASRPGDTISATDGFTVRHSTARVLDEVVLDKVEAVGIVDGLPVWIESSGITADRLLELTAEMKASSETGRVQLTDTSNEFVVVQSTSVDAKVIDHITWYAEGPGIGQSLEVTTLPESNLYQIVVGFFPGLQLIDVAGSVGALGGEEGSTQRLTWEIRPGIQATVIGDYGSELVAVAESITQVSASDPRLPTD